MPILKEAEGVEVFRREAKAYVINMLSGSRKLHKKGCKSCQYSKCFSKYYDFDTLEEAEKSGVEYTLCGNCFREELK